MKRTITKLNLGENSRRIRVRLETEECMEGSLSSKQELANLLHSIADMPDLVACELNAFQTLKIYRDGLKWVAESEAIVEVKNPKE